MDGNLSQEEINALLNGGAAAAAAAPAASADSGGELTTDEMDAIGEIANICMGSAATTMFSLVNRKVDISTPVVSNATWDDVVKTYERPCVFIRIAYTAGLEGSNVLILKEQDVKVITDLMMGGDGTNTDGELGELHLSAISEAMNQMMGASATSLSSMLKKMIDISPPQSNLVDLGDAIDETSIDSFLAGSFVKISFKMEIGDLVDSEIMQLYPYSFAKEMCAGVAAYMSSSPEPEASAAAPSPAPAPQPAPAPSPAPAPATAAPSPAPAPAPQPQQMDPSMMQGAAPSMGMPYPVMMQPQFTAQPAMFTPFTGDLAKQLAQENIDLIMDVPLDVTVELGRTSKSIKEILDFAPGTIIELNKIAGEPIDVLVNGKHVATGEVVVIEESFGVRITEIIK